MRSISTMQCLEIVNEKNVFRVGGHYRKSINKKVFCTLYARDLPRRDAIALDLQPQQHTIVPVSLHRMAFEIISYAFVHSCLHTCTLNTHTRDSS
jgi:hypothetical protein